MKRNADFTSPPARDVADPPSLTVVDAGRVPYDEALALQRDLAEAKKAGRFAEDFLLLVEHEPVVTLGRGAPADSLVVSPDLLAARGVRAVEIERGGDVTYHGPGQLVGYPILDLAGYRRDLHWYMRRLEEALIRALSELGLPAFRVAGYTGVWVGERDGGPSEGALSEGGPSEGGPGDVSSGVSTDVGPDRAASLVAGGRIRKIASIGVHVSRWVTWHGFALNVTEEPLANFELIVPCGIEGVRMTSLESEGCRLRGPRDAALLKAVVGGFRDAFATRALRTLSGLLALRDLTAARPSVARPDADGERESSAARPCANGESEPSAAGLHGV